MGAHVEHRFPKGFILDEERLRKLVNIISSRIHSDNREAPIHYDVFRGDAFWYTTSDVEDVIKEDNADWRRITKLTLKGRVPDRLDLTLTFSEEGTILQIEGVDRDQVFVLFSDIREYLTEEVNVAVTLPHRAVSLTAGFVMIGTMFLFMWNSQVNINRRTERGRERAVQALKSTNVVQKLDALLEPARDSITVFPITAMAVFFIAMFLWFVDVPEKIIAAMFPANVFLFGGQKLRYERRRRLVGNIIWVVAVGGVVSFVTGYVLWKFTK